MMLGFGWFGFLAMALFWTTIVGAVLWLFSNLFPKYEETPKGNLSDTDMVILKKRYALGEITKEEYQVMRNELEVGESL
ncbi:MAG: putative membrane protein [Cellvibrionaceae bacterium]|jgi:putative membrane protein